VRRSVLLLASLFIVATGGVLVGALAGTLGLRPDASDASDASGAQGADTAVVRQFYAAVNATLATGDPAPVAALLAADFAGRATGSGATGEELVHRLLVLRGTFPSLRLVIEDVRENGEQVFACVRVEGADRGAIFGVTVSRTPASWTGLDIFRVAGGRIAERWTTGVEPALPETLARLPLPDPPAEANVGLARLTFAPGAHEPEAALPGPLLLAVEAGRLTVTAFGGATSTSGAAAATAVPEGGVVELGPGDGLLLPPAAHYAVRNAGTSSAVALALALVPRGMSLPADDAIRWLGAGSPDVVVQPLAGGVTTDLPIGAAEITLGRLMLHPGDALAADVPLAPALLAVEAGVLTLAATTGATTLSAGQGTLPGFASYPNLRNAGDGPLVVLLVTYTPSGAAIA